MMRRSSGMGGARMLRAMGRAVGAGVKENLSSAAAGKSTAAKNHRVVSVSSPNSSASSSLSSVNGKGSLTCSCDGDEWEAIGDQIELEGDVSGFGFRERCVFGPAPTKEEAEEAVSTIQQIFVPVTFTQVAEVEYPSAEKDAVGKEIPIDSIHGDCSTESESDWIEPAMQLYSSKVSRAYGQDKILDAFRMLQINPPFKRMVMSLSSDPAVWDAVMKNETVQELKKSFYEVETSEPQSSAEDPDIPKGFLRYIMDITKGKILEFFDKISKLASEVFRPHKVNGTDPFDDVLRSSFMLSILVFVVVVVTRIQRS